MARKNRNPHPSRKTLRDRYDTDYVNMPEYPQYCSIVAVPLKTIFYNLDAAANADDFYVARSYGDAIMRKLARRINCEVIA